MCGVTHITVVSLIYMPMPVPKSSKLQRIPVWSPLLPDGNAVDQKPELAHISLLTFKEGRVLVGIHIDLRELTNADFLWVRSLDEGLRVKSKSVRAERVRFKLVVPERDADRH